MVSRDRQVDVPFPQSAGAFPQSEGPLRIFALDMGHGAFVPPAPQGYAQLVALRSGSATVRCEGIRTLVAPGTAVWVPAGAAYGLELHARCELRILYVAAELGHVRSLGPVGAGALLLELIERAVVAGYLDPAEPRHARVLAVMNDELVALAAAAPANVLVLPRDAALLASVERSLAAFDAAPPIEILARDAAMSPRTFGRRFRRETGITPREWLRRARLARAMAALSGGASVTEAALEAGYSSLSAFVAAYRALFGVTPGRARKENVRN
jgi:AraC-like DNA-binding protein